MIFSRCTCREELRACEAQLATRAAGVLVQGLQLAAQRDFELMKDGEIEKQKHYRALCWADRELQEADEQLLSGTAELVVQQDTPVRVLHRRAPLIRERVRLRWVFCSTPCALAVFAYEATLTQQGPGRWVRACAACRFRSAARLAACIVVPH